MTTGANESRYGVVYASGRFVAVSSRSDALTGTNGVPVVVSSDGVSWTRVPSIVDGVEGVIYTDIGRDGMLSGINIEATVKLAQALTIPVIASGGVGNLDHLADGVLQGRADAVLAAIALLRHERGQKVETVERRAVGILVVSQGLFQSHDG